LSSCLPVYPFTRLWRAFGGMKDLIKKEAKSRGWKELIYSLNG